MTRLTKRSCLAAAAPRREAKEGQGDALERAVAGEGGDRACSKRYRNPALRPTSQVGGSPVRRAGRWTHRLQHGRDLICTMPVNVHGPGDNFDPNGSHLLHRAPVGRRVGVRAPAARIVNCWRAHQIVRKAGRSDRWTKSPQERPRVGQARSAGDPPTRTDARNKWSLRRTACLLVKRPLT